MKPTMKIVIAGSTGFIGSHLVSHLEQKGHELILLSRKRSSSANVYFWDPEEGQLDPMLLEGADVVINLCGENVFGRWSQKKKEMIRKSRIEATRLLCETLLKLNTPPKVYIGASAIGYYGNRDEEILDESSAPGSDFLAEVCQEWEKIPARLSQKNIRVVIARFGIVLGKDGALHHIENAFRTGMGGVLGSGRQIMSWIAIDDVVLAIDHVMKHENLEGPFNFVSPNAVSNAELTETIGKLLNRPTIISVPKFALTMFFGEGAEMFLSSCHVKPKRLLESGFAFHYPKIDQALKKYLLLK